MAFVPWLYLKRTTDIKEVKSNTKLTCMTEEVTKSLTVAGKLPEIIVVNNILKELSPNLKTTFCK